MNATPDSCQLQGLILTSVWMGSHCYYPSHTPVIRLVICLQAWERLERAENDRERVLRDELIRQEKLEQMARRFDRKAAMRETWLLENQRLVAQVNHGQQDYVSAKRFSSL